MAVAGSNNRKVPVVMISHELLRDQGILKISPEGPLESSDFETLSQEVDEYIVVEGALTGVMIRTASFPGWEDFSALISHLNFVKNNHADIGKVAAVTDSKFLAIMPKIVELFISAEVRHFNYDEPDTAMAWLTAELSDTTAN